VKALLLFSVWMVPAQLAEPPVVVKPECDKGVCTITIVELLAIHRELESLYKALDMQCSITRRA
jgi:hypothetical protein